MTAPCTDTPIWDSETDDVLVCRHVIDETHDVRSFIFAPRTPARFRFDPGQFITLLLNIGGQEINRCYTVSSPPTRPDRISITVKRVPGGPVSNWLHDNLRAGSEIHALAPQGIFSLTRHPSPKCLFLSGGSGITPLMSMTRFLRDRADEQDTVFVHCARTPADIIFRAELDLLAATTPRLRIAHIVESADGTWPGHRGRLSLPSLKLIAPDLAEREIFTCGPGPFMAAARAICAEAGHDPARYHEESFTFEDLAKPAATPVATSGAAPAYRIEFTRAGRIIDGGADITILDAAAAVGLNLPSSCTQGMCGTCKSRLISGDVDMNHAGGIRKREIEQGLILLCCSKPRSNLVIER